MTEKVSLADYFDRLMSAPWFYDMCDDQRSYTIGRDAVAQITAIGKQSDDHGELLRLVKLHKFSGPRWGTAQSPLPERPKEEVIEDGS